MTPSARLLAEENTALTEFAALLDKEHVALRGRDIDALETLADARQASVIKLLKIEEERRSLCSMLGYDTDLAGLSRLLAWCDPARTLGKQYAECATRARDCRDLNTRNGVLVGAQIKRVEGLARRHDRHLRRAPGLRPAWPVQSLRCRPGKVLSAEA